MGSVASDVDEDVLQGQVDDFVLALPRRSQGGGFAGVGELQGSERLAVAHPPAKSLWRTPGALPGKP